MAKSEKATVEIDLIPVIWDLGYVRTADRLEIRNGACIGVRSGASW